MPYNPSGSKISTSNLSNFDVAGAGNGDTLFFNTATGKWENNAEITTLGSTLKIGTNQVSGITEYDTNDLRSWAFADNELTSFGNKVRIGYSASLESSGNASPTVEFDTGLLETRFYGPIGRNLANPVMALDFAGTTYAETVQDWARYSNDQFCGGLEYIKSRGATVGSNGALQAGDNIFFLDIYANDGAGNDYCGGMLFETNQAHTGTNKGTVLRFQATPDDSDTAVDALNMFGDGIELISGARVNEFSTDVTDNDDVTVWTTETVREYVGTQGAHIADADGTLADITTKFNTLLSVLETQGRLAAS